MPSNWTTPKTWASGGLAATDLNALRDQVMWLKAATLLAGIDSDTTLGQLKSASYGARAYRDTTLSTTSTSSKVVTMPSESLDTDGLHSTSTNTDRLTIPSGGDGIYLAGYGIEWEANSSGDRRAYLRINNTTVMSDSDQRVRAASSATTGLSTTGLWVAAAGDFVNLFQFQNSGSSIDIENASIWAVRLFAT